MQNLLYKLAILVLIYITLGNRNKLFRPPIKKSYRYNGESSERAQESITKKSECPALAV